MKAQILKDIIINSLRELCKNDLELINNSVKEECINHKLAQYIEIEVKLVKNFPFYHVDIEYNKYKKDPNKFKDQKPIRPDILVHKRLSGNKNNYIVIEAKKSYSSKYDKDKIIYLVKNNSYKYSLGCLISYQPKRAYLIIQFYLPEGDIWERMKYNKCPFIKIGGTCRRPFSFTV